jgi:hypothetical protein
MVTLLSVGTGAAAALLNKLLGNTNDICASLPIGADDGSPPTFGAIITGAVMAIALGFGAISTGDVMAIGTVPGAAAEATALFFGGANLPSSTISNTTRTPIVKLS